MASYFQCLLEVHQYSSYHLYYLLVQYGVFYSNFLGNHEIFFNTSAYIIYQSFFEIIILLFQFSYTDPKSISFIISNFFHNIKNVTVDNSSIVKSVKFSSKWSLDHFSSFFTSWDILIYIIWRHIIFSFWPWFF